MGTCGARVVAVLWVAHAAFLVSVHCCTIFKYIISHYFHIGDKNFMSSDPVFCFIMFNMWSRLQCMLFTIHYLNAVLKAE